MHFSARPVIIEARGRPLTLHTRHKLVHVTHETHQHKNTGMSWVGVHTWVEHTLHMEGNFIRKRCTKGEGHTYLQNDGGDGPTVTHWG